MSCQFSDHQLVLLSDFVLTRTALNFPPQRWGDLERKVCAVSREIGFSDPSEFANWLLSSPLSSDQLEILMNNLTISETYFWREPQAFEALMNEIVPWLVRKSENGGKKLKIWSAGCSSGEEAFSIAIALHKTIPNLAKWDISILATDINPRVLRKALAGVYSNWSFRNPPKWLMNYFQQKENQQYEVIPEIRKMVSFVSQNLAEAVYPSPENNTNAMDIIFCRNVLMYFSQERAKKIVQNFFDALVDGGWLIVSGSELADNLFPQFSSINLPGAILYRKGGAKDQPPEQLHALEMVPPEKSYLKKIVVPSVCLPIHPDQPGWQAVRLLANQGKLGEALTLCEAAIARHKLDSSLHFLHSSILQEQSKETEAISSLRRAIFLDPKFVMAHFALGNLLRRQGSLRGAKKSFENVVDLLAGCEPDKTLPEFEGLTAGRLKRIVQAIIQTETRVESVGDFACR